MRQRSPWKGLRHVALPGQGRGRLRPMVAPVVEISAQATFSGFQYKGTVLTKVASDWAMFD